MPRQVPFTEYEAALLLDAYLKTLSGEKGRMESVRDCSMQLRQMALNAGSEIDDICRNVNGISFQMASMESAYQGHTIMKPATRLFTEIVLLYRNDVARYQQLLKEAKGMASAKIDMDQSDAATTVSFRHINSMAFSKPVSLSYFGEVKPESSWKGLYVDACKSLLDDYPDIFTRLKAESLHGSGKTWLVDAENLHLLAVPKQLEEGLFVETNRNAFDLVKNLKWLLDECSVDYENVVITYTNKDGKKEASVPAPVTTSAFQKKQYYRQDKEDFYRWLQNDQHMAEGTCRSYVSAIRSAEHFAEEHGLASRKLYTCDPTVAKATADELFSNAEFIQYNNDQHNRFRAAITKLLAFYGSNWSPVEASTPRTFERSPLQTKETSIDVAPCKAILVEYFPKGYRLESALDMKRMRRYYEELTGKALDLNQAILETAIRNCGIVYDGRLYMPQNMLSDEMRDQILFFIERCFDEGWSAVYYEAVFREFSEKLLDHNIFNADMLKAYD